MEDQVDDKLNTELHFEQRMCKVIMSMPEAVRDRFKLLKLLSDRRTKTVDASKHIDVKYEKMKQPLYEERAAIIRGDGFKDAYLAKFDNKTEQLKKALGKTVVDSEDCEPIDFKADSVKDHAGLPGFWLRTLKSHHLVADYIRKHDEPILKHLINIKGYHFEDKYGYEMVFTFEANKYMENLELVKTYHLADENILEK